MGPRGPPQAGPASFRRLGRQSVSALRKRRKERGPQSERPERACANGPILRARSARMAACARSFSPCGGFWVPFGSKRYEKLPPPGGRLFRAFRKSTEHSHRRCGIYFFRKKYGTTELPNRLSLYFLPRKYPKRGARTRLGDRPRRLAERSRKTALFARSFRALADANALFPSAGEVRGLKTFVFAHSAGCAPANSAKALSPAEAAFLLLRRRYSASAKHRQECFCPR